MEKLVAGIMKFQQHQFKEHQKLFATLAKGQEPEILFITCSDSRIDPCLITQTRPGDLFIARNAGNLVPPHYAQATTDMDASIEFAMEVLQCRHIVICGHTDCGAMKGALKPEAVMGIFSIGQSIGKKTLPPAQAPEREGQILDKSRFFQA